MDNLKEKSFVAVAWDFGGKFANFGVAFIVSVFLTRLLEPEEFGLIAMVNVIIGFSAVFVDMGLGASLIQRKHLLPIHYDSVFYFNLSVALFLTLILFFNANLIANFYNRPELINITKVLSFTFIVNAIVTVQTTRLKKGLKIKVLTQSRLFSATISGFVGILLAFYGFGVWALIFQNLLSGILFALIIWVISNWRPNLRFSFKALQQLWGFGFRIFLSGVLDAIYTRLDVVFIGKLFAPDTLGFYQRAKSLNQMTTNFTAAPLISILFPVLSEIQNSKIRFNNIVDKAFKVINWVVFLLIGLLFLISKDIYIILFTEKWLPSLPYFRLFLATGFALPLSSVLVNVLRAKGNSKVFLKLEIIKKTFGLLSFTMFFISGLWGFLYARAIVTLFSLLLNMHYARKEIKVNMNFFMLPFIKNLLLMLIITIPLFLIIQISNTYIHLIVVSIVFIAIYLISSFILKISGFELVKVEIKDRINK
ncbi:MAG: lipopolysaccharide biosynthesis protein [Flavobacteriaceae bacterium]|nr:lipopolysaccharide biosynthesis protein [Flavobacteriaceae bacterium]